MEKKMKKVRKIGDKVTYWQWLSIDEGDLYKGTITEIDGSFIKLTTPHGGKKTIMEKDIVDFDD